MVCVSLPQDLVRDGLAHVTLLARLIVQPICLDSCDRGVANLVHKVLQGTNNATAYNMVLHVNANSYEHGAFFLYPVSHLWLTCKWVAANQVYTC